MASSDPNFNTNAASENLMSSVNSNLGFSNLENSLPLENDLYQFLQSTGDAREDFDNFEDELDFPYHIIDSAPSSTCTSACSSAATSPVPYNIYNTPPVTPQPDRTRQNSPTFLALEPQIQQQQPPPLMSGFDSSLTSTPNDSYLRNRLMDPSLSDRTVTIKQEPELLDQMPGYNMSGEELNVQQRTALQLTAQVKNENNNGRVKRSLQQHAGSDDQPTTKKPRNPAKGTAEYQQKREKNNVAVRRSRDKAKQKAMETQHKVQLLTAENKKLHDRVAELTHELQTLKNLLKSLPQYQNNMNA